MAKTCGREQGAGLPAPASVADRAQDGRSRNPWLVGVAAPQRLESGRAEKGGGPAQELGRVGALVGGSTGPEPGSQTLPTPPSPRGPAQPAAAPNRALEEGRPPTKQAPSNLNYVFINVPR